MWETMSSAMASLPLCPSPSPAALPCSRSPSEPPPRAVPGEVAVDSCVAKGTASGGAEPGGAGPRGVEPRGTEIVGAELGGVETGGAEPGSVEPEGVEPGGAASEGVESGGAEPQGAALCGGTGAGGAGAGGAGIAAGAGVIAGIAATGPGGARTRGTGAAGTGGVGGAGAGDPTKSEAAGAGGSGAGGAGAGGAGVEGTSAGGARVGGTGAGGAGAGGAGAVDHGGAVRPRPYFVPLLQHPASPLPAPSPYTEQSGALTEHREPASRPVSPIRTARRAPRSRPPPIPCTHAMTLCPSSVPLRVPLPPPLESSLPEVRDPESDCARAASPTVSRLLAIAVTDPSFVFAATSALDVELLEFAAACRLDYATALVGEYASASPLSVGDRDAADIPTPRSYAEAITGPCSSQWQAAMDAEMASWKSTGTYVDEVPQPGANIVNGIWIFRVKRPPGSPPAFKARYVARGFS
ncbi:unnamed protein product [Closterium sp. NIES-54]